MIRLSFRFIILFLILQGLAQQSYAQKWDLRIMNSMSLVDVTHDNDREDQSIGGIIDLSLSLLVEVDSSFYIGGSIGTLDYNSIVLDQSNIVLGLLAEYKLVHHKILNIGCNAQFNFVKNLTEEYENDVYSTLRLGYGLGANAKIKITDVIKIIAQFGIHNDFYTKKREGFSSFLGKRKMTSIGLSYTFN